MNISLMLNSFKARTLEISYLYSSPCPHSENGEDRTGRGDGRGEDLALPKGRGSPLAGPSGEKKGEERSEKTTKDVGKLRMGRKDVRKIEKMKKDVG